MQVAVHKDFGRRGIATHLTTLLEQNAIKKGYKVGYAQCTSLYSAKAM
jgi:ribosomal protein S18 acetylase RimI-like enzyme